MKDKAYEIARTCKYDWYQRALDSMVYTFFDKKKRVYARFKDNIWAADLAGMGSLTSKNKNVKHLLYHRCFHQIYLG